MKNKPFQISESYQPGTLGRLVEMHGIYYAQEWNFGPFFETKVASEAAQFFGRYDNDKDRVWFVSDGDRVVGSLIIDGGDPATSADTAHLRWFILDDGCRGHGIGDKLMSRATTFCDENGFTSCYLTTFAGLDAACALYKRHGFELVMEERSLTWGTEVIEQRWERKISVPSSC